MAEDGDPQFGADQTFVTAPAAGGGATGVTAGRATLTGTIDPHGVATSYHFNYGPTAAMGRAHRRLMGARGMVTSWSLRRFGAVAGYDLSCAGCCDERGRGGSLRVAMGLFRTAPAPTAVVIGPTGVSTDAATLVGEVNTFGLTGSYHFDVWSLDSSYRMSTRGAAGGGYRVGRACERCVDRAAGG